MAVPEGKRRKLEHLSSDDDDEVSFASFGGLGEDELGADVGAEGDGVGSDGSIDESEAEIDARNGIDGTESDLDDEDEPDVVLAKNERRQDEPGRPKQAAAVGTKSRRSDAASGSYTAGTFKSNMFKLQVDELLEQIRPRRGKREEAAEQALHALKKTLDGVAPRGPQTIEDAERQLLMSSKVAIPFPNLRPPKDAKYKLEFAKPANVNLIGSYALKTNSRSSGVLELDMMVTMPSSLFQEKDYLNHRYFYKRAYYLTCLAAALKDAHSSTYQLRFQDFHGDQLKPILVVNPQSPPSPSHAKPALKWRINIVPCIAADVFPAEKLSPGNNCVRLSSDPKSQPTPFYNSSLRADMLMPTYLNLLHHATSTCDAIRDACLLGVTWLRQRGFGSSIDAGGFGNFEWAVLIALLLRGGGPGGKPILNEGYSSYQLLKAALQLLAVKDLSTQAFVIGSSDMKPVGNGSPMLWDAARAHNVFYKVVPWGYSQLRQEAKTTLSTLGDQLFDGFESTFILRKDSLLTRYDCLVELPTAAIVDGKHSEDRHVQYKRLHETLKRGLGDRAKLVCLHSPSASAWSLASARPLWQADVTVKIGLLVNPETVHRTVDHGPTAESKAEAASFRQFWGEKAELRRFKDGSIMESLVWAAGEGSTTVLEQVIRFLLARHFGSEAGEQAAIIGHGFVRMLRQGSSLAGFQPLMEAYKQMEVDIRGLEGLPLSIRQIMPADPQLRYASVRPPSDVTDRSRPVPANVTIQFEGSARWPDDLVAIQRTKIAFLLKLSELLRDSSDKITARLGLENQDSEILNQAYLDIIYNSGMVFRMRIYHDREQTLLERQLKDKSLAASTKEAAALGLATHKRDYLRVPVHTQAVARLCSRYPALSGTIRLLKKWFASHLLASHVPEEVIEIIAIRSFVQPWPWQTPSSVQTGFLRTLHWLSRWDWRADPLIVDFSGSGELKQADVQAMRSRFEAWRKVDPSLNRVVLFAASSLDADGTTWTDHSRPSRVVAGRMTALASAASAEVEQKQSALEPASLFASSLRDFDFVLHLDPTLTGGSKRQKGAANGTAFKNLELASHDDDTTIGFDTVQLFLAELQELYGSSILLFSGGTEKPVIAGLWSPQTAPRAWKVNLAYSTVPSKATKEDGDVLAMVNKESILAEIARLGGDMIEKVEVNRR